MCSTLLFTYNDEMESTQPTTQIHTEWNSTESICTTWKSGIKRLRQRWKKHGSHTRRQGALQKSGVSFSHFGGEDCNKNHVIIQRSQPRKLFKFWCFPSSYSSSAAALLCSPEVKRPAAFTGGWRPLLTHRGLFKVLLLGWKLSLTFFLVLSTAVSPWMTFKHIHFSVSVENMPYFSVWITVT